MCGRCGPAITQSYRRPLPAVQGKRIFFVAAVTSVVATAVVRAAVIVVGSSSSSCSVVDAAVAVVHSARTLAAGGGTSCTPVLVVADPADLTTCALEAGDVGAGFEGQVCPLQNRMQKTHCCAVPAAVADHPLVIARTRLVGAVVVWIARQAKTNRTFYEGLAQWVALVDI